MIVAMLMALPGVGLGMTEIDPGINDVLIKCGKPGIAEITVEREELNDVRPPGAAARGA